MFKDKLSLHQYVLFGVLLVLTLWSLVTHNFTFNIGLLWWLLGAMIGFLFVFTDQFINGLLMKSEGVWNLKLKVLFEKKRAKEILTTILSEQGEQKELVMRSFLFVMAWLVLAFLTITSVASPFPRGFVLGIGTHLVFDLVFDYNQNKEKFNLWFWQIKRPLSVQEKRGFVWGVTILYVLLAFRF